MDGDALPVGPGIYPTMSAATYHADPCVSVSLSSGVLRRLINGTPAHAFAAHPRLGKGDDNPGTKRTDFGSAAHRYILGRGAEVEVLPFSDYRKDAAKDARDAARDAGKIPLLLHDFNAVQLMVPPARALLDSIATGPAQAEVVIVWAEQFLIDGKPFEFLCRIMVDSLWRTPMAVDYKTAKDCSPQAFGRILYAEDYDIQRAFYMRGIRAVFGKPARFVFLAQEMDTGICCLHEPDEHGSELAASMVEMGIRAWATALKRNEWPGYGTETHMAIMPMWKAQRIEYARA